MGSTRKFVDCRLQREVSDLHGVGEFVAGGLLSQSGHS